jgi:2,3-bisphosphoglycerate-independent phosphoglycerate mutase
MKRIIIIHSGISEDPMPRFEGRSPLQVARHPALDSIARTGVGGMVMTIPNGCPPSSEIGTAVLLGWSRPPWPARAPLEVLGRELSLHPGTFVFRANFMTVVDDALLDHTAGDLETREAELMIEDLNRALAPFKVRLHGGGRHRVLLEVTDPEVASVLEKASTAPPQDLIGRVVDGHLPSGPGSDILRTVIRTAEQVLESHDVNRVRLDLGENPATTLWPWGGGRVPARAADAAAESADTWIVSDSPVIRGLGRTLDYAVSPVGRGDRRPGYTDLLNRARNGLESHKTVVVYTHRADDATHRGDAAGKIREIEAFDHELVAPLAQAVAEIPDWTLVAGSDHRSLSADRRHDRGLTPIAIAGSAIEADACEAFHERALANGSLAGRAASDLLSVTEPHDEGTGATWV